VFIKNLPDTLSENDLRDLFAPFGNIISLKLACNEDGTSKCFGFVAFAEPNDAAKAVQEINGTIVGDKVVYAGRAQKKAGK